MAGDSKLTQTFSTDDSKLLASYDKILRKQQDVLSQTLKMAADSRRASESGKQGLQDQAAAGDRLSSSISGAVLNIGKMVAGYASARSGVVALNAEIQKTIQLQAEAAKAVTSAAPSQISLRQNLGNVNDADWNKIQAKIESLSAKGLGDYRTLSTAYGSLASATPTATHDERLQMLEVAASVASKPEEISTLAAGLGDVSKLTHSKDAKVNLGVALSAQQKSRSEDLTPVMQNIMPAAADIHEGYGGTEAEALALVETLQGRMLDPEGRIPATAARQLASQAHDYFAPKAARERIVNRLNKEGSLAWNERPDDELRKSFGEFMVGEMPQAKGHTFEEQLKVFKHDAALQEKYFSHYEQKMAAARTPRQQIEYLQANPAEREQFLEGFHSEEKAKQPIRELLSGEGETAQDFRQFADEGIVTGAQAGKLAETTQGKIANDPYVRQARAAASIEAAADKMKRVNEPSARGGIAREGLKKLNDASGLGWTEQQLSRVEFELNSGLGSHGAYDQLIAASKKREDELRGSWFKVMQANGGARLSPDEVERQRVDTQQADALKEMRENLEGFAETSRQAREQQLAPPTGGAPAPGWRGTRLPEIGDFGISNDNYEAVAAEFENAGGLNKHGILDEYDMLRKGEGADAFAGHEADLEKLDLMTQGQIQHEKETANNPEMLATLKSISDGIQGMLTELKDVKKETAAMKDATKNAASEQRAANRSAGAQATRASGRE